MELIFTAVAGGIFTSVLCGILIGALHRNPAGDLLCGVIGALLGVQLVLAADVPEVLLGLATAVPPEAQALGLAIGFGAIGGLGFRILVDVIDRTMTE